MPRVVCSLACSLDGFIAGPDGDVEFLRPYDDALANFGQFIKGLGAIVMGRGTYDFMVEHPPPPGVWFYGDLPMYVFSHRELQPLIKKKGPPARVERRTGTAAALLEELAQFDGDIWLMGGGRTIKMFLDEGKVDKWHMTMVPVRLGKGIPMFLPGETGPETLKLAGLNRFVSGAVELRYERGKR